MRPNYTGKHVLFLYYANCTIGQKSCKSLTTTFQNQSQPSKVHIYKMNNTQIIDNNQNLINIVQEAMQNDAVALDTEFVWERTYYPQLGLIQLALSDERCYAIDPIAITDFSSLGALLTNKNIVKILHDAPQDLTILGHVTNCVPQNIFDTRLAAGFAGLPSTISLSQLINELLETPLNKSETRTNWLKRPLTEKQLKYALDDVRYLRAARVLLLGKIIGPRIKSWLQEELNLLNNSSYYGPICDEDRYKKIRGSRKFKDATLLIVKNLSIWREQKAKHLDRPRGHIIKDKTILEIAATTPSLKSDFQSITISDKAIDRHGKEILQVVSDSLATNPKEHPQNFPSDLLSAKEKKHFQYLKDLISLKCDILGIDSALIGNNNELKRVVKSLNSGMNSDSKQTAGWRKEFLRDFFASKNS